MGNVKYKEPSKGIRSMIDGVERSARTSLGHDGNVEEYYRIKLDSLMPYSEQAREFFDDQEIDDLAETIRIHGVLNPLVVVKSSNNVECYEIISGERRFRAAKKIGMETVPCIIVGDSDRLPEIALIDNMQRAGLHPIEIGVAFSKLCQNNPHKQHQEIAQDIGVSKSKFSQYLRLSNFHHDVRSWLLMNKQASLRTLRNLDTNITLEELQHRKRKILTKGTVFKIEIRNGELEVSATKIALLDDKARLDLKKMLEKLMGSL